MRSFLGHESRFFFQFPPHAGQRLFPFGQFSGRDLQREFSDRIAVLLDEQDLPAGSQSEYPDRAGVSQKLAASRPPVRQSDFVDPKIHGASLVERQRPPKTFLVARGQFHEVIIQRWGMERLIRASQKTSQKILYKCTRIG